MKEEAIQEGYWSTSNFLVIVLENYPWLTVYTLIFFCLFFSNLKLSNYERMRIIISSLGSGPTVRNQYIITKVDFICLA